MSALGVLVLLQAGLFLPAASADVGDLPTIAWGQEGSTHPPAFQALLDMIQSDGDPWAIERFILAQMRHQGLLDTAMPLAAEGRNPPRGFTPPDNVYRDAHHVCDLDGDGINDLVVNDVRLPGAAPYHMTGWSMIRAFSGVNGTQLWKADNMRYIPLVMPIHPTTERAGDGLPDPRPVVIPFVDVNGDGVCDVAAWGETDQFRFMNEDNPAKSYRMDIQSHVRVLDGTNGEPLWTVTFQGYAGGVMTSNEEVLTYAFENFPTGFLAYATPSGPKVVVKTSTYELEWVKDSTGLTQRLPGREEPFTIEEARMREQIHLLDGRTGEAHWVRDLSTENSPHYLNLTWFAGVVDLTKDGEPDLVLDSYMQMFPRSQDRYNPVTGEPLFRSGRGMRVFAIDGSLEAAGKTLWSTLVLDPGVVRVNPDAEENFETILWTRAKVLVDYDRDEVPEILASYHAEEEGLETSVDGRRLTHFVLLSGVNGTKRWDIRQQGWGFGGDLGGGLLGLGTLDIPSQVPPSGRFPPKFARIVVLSAGDGGVAWSYAKTWGQNSILSYNMALLQYAEALAPGDYDGDGILDVVTPAQYVPPSGPEQVLMAIANHTYEVLSGADGDVINTLRAWGPTGRVISCGGDKGNFTVISGHGRRLDVTRLEVLSGDTVWRKTVYNDPAPRSATAGVETVAIGSRCSDKTEDQTFVNANLHAYSYTRGSEIRHLMGTVLGEGNLSWLQPELQGLPPTNELYQAAHYVPPPPPSPLVLVFLGGLLGVTAGGVALLTAARTRPLRSLLAVTLIMTFLINLATPMAGALLASDPLVPGDSGPLASPQRLLPPEVDARTQEAPSSDAQGLGGAPAIVPPPPPVPPAGPTAPPRPAASSPPEHDQVVPGTIDLHDNNDSISYTYDIGDVNGDGYGDLLLDTYCVDYDVCSHFRDSSPTGYVTQYIDKACTWGHRAFAVSGADGVVLWARDLTPRNLWLSCERSYIVGTMPLEGNKTGFVLYNTTKTQAATNVNPTIYTHRVSMLDAATSNTLWSHQWTGFMHPVSGGVNAQLASLSVSTIIAETQLLHTFLQKPTREGLAVEPGLIHPRIYVHGIGYHATASIFDQQKIPAQPYDSSIPLYSSYNPRDWVAAIEPTTGEILWENRDAFDGVEGRSSFVASYRGPPLWEFPHEGVPPPQVFRYWQHVPCCFDLTGDSIPDMAFTVYEWTNTPFVNMEGPYFLDSRMVTLDGATGGIHVDKYVSTDIRLSQGDRIPWSRGNDFWNPFTYVLSFEALGDVNGDGVSDILLKEEFNEEDHRITYTVADGLTGDFLWNWTNPRDTSILVIGDADGDGGNDLLYFDWYGRQTGWPKLDRYVTPMGVPLTLLSGATGERLWSVTTYMAPSDLMEMFNNMRRSGLPDVDGDGVADVLIDDPQYLGDLTVVHHATIVSGKNAEPLGEMTVLGQFLFPVRMGDFDRDGKDEMGILSGDVNDLWLTMYQGSTGEANWSRRLISVPLGGYASAIPNMRFHELKGLNDTFDGLVVNFHLEAMGVEAYLGGNPDEPGYFVYRGVPMTNPQVLHIQPGNGTTAWAVPKVWDPLGALSAIPGPTHATGVYLGIVGRIQASTVDHATEKAPEYLPGVYSFGTTFLSTFGIGVVVLRMRRIDQEVPDLV